MEYLQDNSLLIITIVAFIAFAIIGYVVDSKKNKGINKKEKEILTEEIKEEEKINEDNKDSKEVDLNNLTKK